MEVLGYGILFACSFGLGLTVVVEAVKLLVANGLRAKVASRITGRGATLTNLDRQLHASSVELRRREADLDRVKAEQTRLNALLKASLADRVEIVHEIGTADGSRTLFVCDLRPAIGLQKMAARRLVFARDIWRHRNVAHVWADSIEDALSQADRAFAGRSSVGLGRLRADVPGSAAPVPAADVVEPEPPVPRRPATMDGEPAV